MRFVDFRRGRMQYALRHSGGIATVDVGGVFGCWRRPSIDVHRRNHRRSAIVKRSSCRSGSTGVRICWRVLIEPTSLSGNCFAQPTLGWHGAYGDAAHDQRHRHNAPDRGRQARRPVVSRWITARIDAVVLITGCAFNTPLRTCVPRASRLASTCRIDAHRMACRRRLARRSIGGLLSA